MKAAVIDVIPDLTGLVSALVYGTNCVCFLLVCFNFIKWVQKTRQVYDPKTKMVRDAHFLRLDVTCSYNYNMK